MPTDKKGEQAPGKETIDKLAAGIYPSLAMLAGMELGVFTALGKGALNSKELASTLSVSERRLQPLLYALVAAGLLTLDNGGFANTLESRHYLVKGSPTFIGNLHIRYRIWWEAVLQTAATIREDRPVAGLDFSTLSPEEIRKDFSSRDSGNRAAGRTLAKQFNFSQFKHLADVGGAAGSLALGAAEICPNLRLSLVDLPSTVAVARKYLAERGEEDRIEVIAADITSEPLSARFDVAVMRNLIQVLSPEQARQAIMNVGQALEPGGMLLVIGHVVDDTRLSPPDIVSYGLVFINLYQEGGAYTEGEYRNWLTEAGLSKIVRHLQPDATSVIVARIADR